MEFQVKFGDKKAIADLITNALVGNGFSVHSIDFHEKGELGSVEFHLHEIRVEAKLTKAM